MATLTDRLANWKDHLPRTVIPVIVVLLLLLAAWVLPVRIASFGTSALFFLVGAGLLLLLGVHVWPALLVLVCYAPFAGYLRYQGFSALQSLFKDLFALGVVGLWALGALIRREKWVRSPLDLPLLLLLVLGALNVLRAPTLLRGLLACKILFTYIPLYWLVVHYPPSRRQLQVLLWALLIVGAAVAVYGILQYAFGMETFRAAEGADTGLEIPTSSWRWGQVRAFSTFGHPGVFSLFLAMCLALALGLLRGASRAGRMVLGLLMVPIVLAMPLTLARTGWFALLAVILALLVLSHSNRARLGLLTVVALAALAFSLGGPIVERTLDFTASGEDVSWQERPALLYWAARMTFVERPEGCGMGVLPDAAALASRVTRAYEQPTTCFWHGYPLQTGETVVFSLGVQMGALGSLLYILIFVLIWKHGLRTYRALSDSLLKGIAAGILGYVAAMTFSNFFSGSALAYPVVDLYFWLFVGVLMSLKRIEETAG